MRTILASAAAALALVATPAIANTENVEVRVAVADIDLSTAEGRAAFEARVERQVRKACRIPGALDASPAKTDWACVRTAKAAALAQAERADEQTRVAFGAD